MENKIVKTVTKKKDIFADKLAKMCEGLIYMSETDAEFTVYKGAKNETLSKETMLAQINGSPNVACEEQNFDNFFLRLTTCKDWFGEFEKQKAKQFGKLQDLLKTNLKNLKIFRIGKIQIDIYIVGTDSENNTIGLKTKSVET